MMTIGSLRILAFFLAGVLFHGSATAEGTSPPPKAYFVPSTKGQGKSHEEAIEKALRAAVEEGLGVLVKSETRVKNNQLISDSILAKSRGFVKSYKEVGDAREVGGLREVEIEATVTEEGIVDELTALGILMDTMGNPRVLVAPKPGNKLPADLSEAVYGGIVEVLSDKTFDVVDKRLSDEFASEQADILGDNLVGKAAEYGLKHQAEYVVLYNANDLGINRGDVLGVRKVQVSCELINLTTALILGNKAKIGKAGGPGPEEGFLEATRGTGKEAIQALLEAAVRNWNKWMMEGQPVTVVLEGIGDDLQNLMFFEEVLVKIEGVVGVDRREWGGGKATIQVMYKGKPSRLQDYIYSEMKAAGWTLEPVRFEGNRMIWTCQKRTSKGWCESIPGGWWTCAGAAVAVVGGAVAAAIIIPPPPPHGGKKGDVTVNW